MVGPEASPEPKVGGAPGVGRSGETAERRQEAPLAKAVSGAVRRNLLREFIDEFY